MFHNVALIKGSDRLNNIKAVLELLKDDIIPKIKKVKEITIKPNMVTVFRQLAATHRDAIKPFLDFLVQNNYQGKIIIAESSAIGTAMEGFRNYKYNKLKDEFSDKFNGFEFIDLNKEEAEEENVLNRKGQALKILVSKRILNAEYLVSVCPAKTHDTVIATLSVKNAVIGAILIKENRFYSLAKRKLLGDNAHTNYKAMMHQGYKTTNRNIVNLYRKIPIQLSVIDGTEAMEGDGPVSGSLKKLNWCLGSTNAVGADATAAKLMGFNLENIGYLNYLGTNVKNVKIIGDEFEKCVGKVKPHRTYHEQLRWK